MHLVFDIFQGIGVAAAVGIRPFLPGLVTGALAAGSVEIDFAHTDFHFLQQPAFLLAMVVGVIALAAVDRGSAARRRHRRAVVGVIALFALVIGALLCGGAIARSHHPAWIGIVAGVLCAALGIAAMQPLLTRVRARLDAEAGGVLPVIVDAAAGLAAALSIVAPPIGVIVVAALVWLLIAGRTRAEQKYAGLRILR